MAREFTLELPPVRGRIPPELDGCYARIGPNPIVKVNPANHHWFIGDGMVHGVRLQGGKALWYRNRWIRSTQVSQALGEAPQPGPRRGSDTVNTNVLAHAGKPWALVEAGGYPVQLSATLDTVAHDPFGGSLKGSFSAHPAPGHGHRRACTPSATTASDPNTLRHVVVGRDGRVQREEPIAVQHGPSVHDCMITEHHVIVLDLPVTFSMASYVAGYGFPYAWNPAHPARVGVLRQDRAGERHRLVRRANPATCSTPATPSRPADGRITLDVVAHADDVRHSRIGPVGRQRRSSSAGPSTSRRARCRGAWSTRSRRSSRAPTSVCIGKPYRYA